MFCIENRKWLVVDFAQFFHGSLKSYLENFFILFQQKLNNRLQAYRVRSSQEYIDTYTS